MSSCPGLLTKNDEKTVYANQRKQNWRKIELISNVWFDILCFLFDCQLWPAPVLSPLISQLSAIKMLPPLPSPRSDLDNNPQVVLDGIQYSLKILVFQDVLPGVRWLSAAYSAKEGSDQGSEDPSPGSGKNNNKRVNWSDHAIIPGLPHQLLQVLWLQRGAQPRH